MDTILDYVLHGGTISAIVLLVLSFYLILVFYIFIYKLITLGAVLRVEKRSLAYLASGGDMSMVISKLKRCIGNSTISKELLKACETSLIRELSSGTTWLSIISSTAPFIGLFGTVVGILDSFAKFATQTKVGFSVIAPAISEALVATAAGIFVAIFAYTFHQLIVRKLYIISTYLKSQSEILMLKG
ncbi:MAG: MotA/TolQ/ExbB proton channel family protein [Epsilonproteobacteria bacterium]|nr:MAG: MotA/TolQ/ExbB proton channel family protein [Campylobacterota bacterium]